MQSWNRNCSGAEIAIFCHEPFLYWAELSSYHCAADSYTASRVSECQSSTQGGAVNCRLRQVIPEANGIWEEGLLVNHGSGIGLESYFDLFFFSYYFITV